jgi:hypothetical protein
MAKATAFWSYVHKDDDAEGGRIARLARDIVDQYEMMTGDEIELFLDREHLAWGEQWKPTIDEVVSTAAFFISVITPRYFQRSECRRELNLFVREAKALGSKELVLPIVYLDVPALKEDAAGDEAVALVQSLQWADWTQLRFASPDSPEYRAAVARLATRLAEANAIAEQPDDVPDVGREVSDEAGLVDRLAVMEEAMPKLATTVIEATALIESIGTVASDAAAAISESDAADRGFAGRLAVLRRLSSDLAGPAGEILALGQAFTSELHKIDDGMGLLIEQAAVEARDDVDSLDAAIEFFDLIRGLTVSADEGLGGLSMLMESMEPAEKMSRDLRPVFRDMRQGLTLFVEGRDVMREWTRLVDSLSPGG